MISLVSQNKKEHYKIVLKLMMLKLRIEKI